MATSVAGCLGDDDDSPEGADEDQTVLQVHGFPGDGEGQEVKDRVRENLWDAGLPEDIFVEIQDTAETTDETLDQYRTWLSAERDEPHMMMFDSGWTIPFIERGQLLNVEEILDSSTVGEIQDNYFQASLASATGQDGNLYGIPLFPDFPTMQYRKDLVEDAGYSTDGWQTNPLSWAEFAEITSDVYDQNSGDLEYGYTFQADNYEGLSCCNFNEWQHSWGGAFFGDPEENLFGPVGDRPITVNEQPTVDSIQMVKSFVYGSDHDDAMDDITGDIASSDAFGWTEETSRAPMANGNVVMHRNWPYAINIHAADPADHDGDGPEPFGEDYGVMPIPFGVEEGSTSIPNTGGTASALGGWNMVANPNVEDDDVIDAMGELIETTMTAEWQVFMLTGDNMGFIPPRPDVLEGDDARDHPTLGRYIDALVTAGENAVPRPVTVVWPDQSSAIADEANAAYRDEKTAQGAMDDLAERLEAIEAEA